MRLRLLFKPRNRQRARLRNRQVLIVGSLFLAAIVAIVVVIFRTAQPLKSSAADTKDTFHAYQGLSFQKVIHTMDGCYITSDGTNFVKMDTSGAVVWAKAVTPPYSMIITGLAQATNGDCVAVCQSSDTSSYKIGVIRISSAGALEWFKILSAAGSDFAYGISADNDNGVILSGGGCNVSHYIMKIDQDGNVNWMKDFGVASSTGCAYKVIVEPDNSIVMAGRVTLGTNNYLSMIKTDQYGNYLWGKEIADVELPIVKSFINTTDGAFVMAGTYISQNGNQPNNPFVTKIDVNGNVIWFKRVGDSAVESINDLAPAPGGGMMVIGNVYINEAENVNALLMRLDENGNIIWQKSVGNYDFSGAGYDDAYSICQGTDGNYNIVGMAYWTYISKMDINGNGFCYQTPVSLSSITVDCQSINTTFAQAPSTVFQSANIGGSTHNIYVPNPNSCSPSTTATAVETVTPPSDDVTFSLFPNPNDGNFNINYHLPIEGNGNLQIFDLTGKKMSNIELPSYTNSISVHLPQLVPGIYLYRISEGTKLLKQQKFIVAE